MVQVVQPGRKPIRVVVTADLEVGRDCDGLLLGDPRTSRRHATLMANAGGLTVLDMMIPGVQNPHWLAPVAVNASTHRARVASSRPSSVVTSRPASRATGVTHATRGAPSTHTVQHPHCP